MMQRARHVGFVLIACLGATSLAPDAYGQRYELVWADEFDGPDVDRSAWTFWDGGAYNSELQCYTDDPENAFIQDGVLHLQARRETRTCRTVSGGEKQYDYTSARIESWPAHGAGAAGKAWRYGRFEYRAKLPPENKGLWPALWLMPARPQYGGWPYSGEIDVMEYRSNEPTSVHGTIHFSALAYPGSGNANTDRRSSGGDYSIASGSFGDDFHVFAVEWDEDGIRWFVDEDQFYEIRRNMIEQTAEVYPFNQPFYFILNLAVGGHYLPNPDATTVLPSAMLVDYVRVYQDANEAPEVSLALEGDVKAKATVQLTPVASDPDGSVVRVEFFLDGVPLGSTSSAPFVFDWTTPTDGCYDVGVKAIDNDGGASPVETTPVVVGTGCEQGSYFEAPLRLPGVVPLSGFDLGGQGLAFNDTTPLENLGNDFGNTFRVTEGVDLLPMDNPEDGSYVAFVDEGEWLAYSVEVDQTGDYDVQLTARSVNANARVRVEIDGQYAARFVRLSPTADGAFKTSTVEGVSLTAGIHELRLIAETSGPELHRLAFVAGAASSTMVDNDQAASELGPSHPNPFVSTTQISYTLANPGPVSLAVFDTLGRQVATILDDVQPAGESDVVFDRGSLADGVYFLVLDADGDRSTQPVHLVGR